MGRTDARALYNFVDLPSGSKVTLNNDAGVSLSQRGHVWSDWVSMDGGVTATVRVGAASSPATQGVQLDGMEFRTYATGAIPYFPALRFPGQYADAETDKHTNWNRFYDPSTGRYLQPELLLRSRSYVRSMSSQGIQVPAYYYVSNNPINYIDPDGLKLILGWWTRWAYPDRVADLQTVLDFMNNPDTECACGLTGGGVYKGAPWKDRDIIVNIDWTPFLNGVSDPVDGAIMLNYALTPEMYAGVIGHESGHFRPPYVGHVPFQPMERERFNIPEAHCASKTDPKRALADVLHCACDTSDREGP